MALDSLDHLSLPAGALGGVADVEHLALLCSVVNKPVGRDTSIVIKNTNIIQQQGDLQPRCIVTLINL